MFRLGACPGGNKNLVVWVNNALEKRDLPNDLIVRGDGVWQGGASVMVSLGLCYEGVGALRFAPAGCKINAAHYLEIANNTYLPDCHAFYGVPPSCVFQQDGATAHTANRVQDYCADKFPRFWGKTEWPACSPDLNPLDYFAWGYLQAEVDKRKPKCLDSLKVAIRQSVDALPLEMVRRSLLNFYKRVCMCVENEGRAFKRKKFEGEMPPIAHGSHDDEESRSGSESGLEERKEKQRPVNNLAS